MAAGTPAKVVDQEMITGRKTMWRKDRLGGAWDIAVMTLGFLLPDLRNPTYAILGFLSSKSKEMLLLERTSASRPIVTLVSFCGGGRVVVVVGVLRS